MRDLVVAAACVNSRVGDETGNLARLSEMAHRAAGNGAELILFPEACLTGYGLGEDVASAAQSLDGPAVKAASELAAELGVELVVGLMEAADSNELFLTQLLIGADGKIIGVYRKVHLGPTETERFSAGADPQPVCDGDTCFGLQLCYDGHFPELSTIQADGGAEVLLVAHASPGLESPQEKRDRWLRYLPARAYDNTAYLAACNQVGDNGRGLEFAGVALIIGPKGEVLAEYAGEEPGLAVAELPAAYLKRIRKSKMGFFRAARRPDLYGDLVD